jgi:hypothetical protein
MVQGLGFMDYGFGFWARVKVQGLGSRSHTLEPDA